MRAALPEKEQRMCVYSLGSFFVLSLFAATCADKSSVRLIAVQSSLSVLSTLTFRIFLVSVAGRVQFGVAAGLRAADDHPAGDHHRDELHGHPAARHAQPQPVGALHAHAGAHPLLRELLLLTPLPLVSARLLAVRAVSAVPVLPAHVPLLHPPAHGVLPGAGIPCTAVVLWWPDISVSPQISLYSWRESYVPFLLSELVNILMFFHVGATFSPLYESLLTRSFDGTLQQQQLQAAAATHPRAE